MANSHLSTININEHPDFLIANRNIICLLLSLRNTNLRPDDKVIDQTAASLVEAFKVTYGGDKEDDVPAAGAKRSSAAVSTVLL